jgi:hypothetical protein
MSARLESLLDSGRRSECQRHDEEMAFATRTFTRAARMVTTSTGLTIGIAFQPRPQAMGTHAEAIQAALLNPRTARPLSPLQRLVGAVVRFL